MRIVFKMLNGIKRRGDFGVYLPIRRKPYKIT